MVRIHDATCGVLLFHRAQVHFFFHDWSVCLFVEGVYHVYGLAVLAILLLSPPT